MAPTVATGREYFLTAEEVEATYGIDLVTAETLPDLPAIYELMLDLGIRRWSLFFLITMGRGKGMQEVSPGDSEKLMHWLYEMSKQAPFAIATTEATHYRRVATREMASEGMDEQAIEATPVGRGFGIRDGNGILFISHEGAVNPSGLRGVLSRVSIRVGTQ